VTPEVGVSEPPSTAIRWRSPGGVKGCVIRCRGLRRPWRGVVRRLRGSGARAGQFLRDDLKLELSETKTLITHARTRAARFLGYEITVQHDDRKITAGRRTLNGGIRLSVPNEVITTKRARYTQRGQPQRRPELMNAADYAIVSPSRRPVS
jgi:hypothetical protein